MRTEELSYTYPETLVAKSPSPHFRTLLARAGEPVREISKREIWDLFQPGDTLVVNDSKVLKRRVFTAQGLEILFLKELSPTRWEVLFPAREISDDEIVSLPNGSSFRLMKRGLPQEIEVNKPLTEDFFAANAELALPPYIQKARDERRPTREDEVWYQTAWAKAPGSLAAPTASLHFTNEDLDQLRARGVNVKSVTLHVGIGTFLPVKAKELEEHVMHPEFAVIPAETIEAVVRSKLEKKKVWALGTTAVRALESWASGLLQEDRDHGFMGATQLFIRPGYKFEVVDGLLTNFHQPNSTLLALVGAFFSLENVKKAYAYAIEHQFRLFSYGDLSIWIPERKAEQEFLLAKK